MTKKVNMTLKERTLLPVKLEIRRFQSTKHFAKSFKMGVKIIKNDDIVHVDKIAREPSLIIAERQKVRKSAGNASLFIESNLDE